MKSDCTVHYLLIFFLTILPILFLKEKNHKNTTNTYMFIYLYIKHVSCLFLIAMSFGTSLLLLRLIMVWWFGTHSCAVVIPDAAVLPKKSSVLYG